MEPLHKTERDKGGDALMVSREEAIRLIRKYEPVLFLHPDETWIPVHPGRFMEHSALWSAQPYRDPAGKHLRANWKKLIRKGTITLNPAKHNQPFGNFADEKWRLDLNPYLERDDDPLKSTDLLTYPGSSSAFLNNTQDGFLFLNGAGWSDKGVTKADVTKSRTMHSSLPSLTAEPYRYRYFAQVLDLKGLEAILIDIKDTMADQSWVKLLSGFFDQKWIIWYYFFFPFHEEGSTGNTTYEGDWTAIAVVVEKPLLEAEKPLYLGFGQRTRGNCKENLEYMQPIVDIIAGPMQMFWQRMEVAAWDAVTKAPGTLHPRIYVTRGTHNLYVSPGNHNPGEIPIFGKACELVSDVDKGVGDVVDTVEDAFDDVKDSAIIVTKALLIPFPFNLIALACEYPASGEVSTSTPPAGSTPEATPAEGVWGSILKPPAMDRRLLFEPTEMQRWGWDPANPDAQLNTLDIHDWYGTDDEVLMREMDIWWPDVNGNAGYQGLWGAVVQEDPYEYRSGMSFPGFKKAFLVGLGLHFLAP
jgi:hypothetical protein